VSLWLRLRWFLSRIHHLIRSIVARSASYREAETVVFSCGRSCEHRRAHLGRTTGRDASLLPWLLETHSSGWSRDSEVCIATGYGLDDRGIGDRAPVGSRIFSTVSRPALGRTQPPIKWVPAALSLGVKRPGLDAGHSLPTSVEIRRVELYLYSFISMA
jgi:hypothetical protein